MATGGVRAESYMAFLTPGVIAVIVYITWQKRFYGWK